MTWSAGEDSRGPRGIDDPSLWDADFASVSHACLAKIGTRPSVFLERHALDTLVCFVLAIIDFSSVSETEAKLKNEWCSLDRNRRAWDIEIKRHTLHTLIERQAV